MCDEDAWFDGFGLLELHIGHHQHTDDNIDAFALLNGRLKQQLLYV